MSYAIKHHPCGLLGVYDTPHAIFAPTLPYFPRCIRRYAWHFRSRGGGLPISSTLYRARPVILTARVPQDACCRRLRVSWSFDTREPVKWSLQLRIPSGVTTFFCEMLALLTRASWFFLARLSHSSFISDKRNGCRFSKLLLILFPPRSTGPVLFSCTYSKLARSTRVFAPATTGTVQKRDRLVRRFFL